MAVSQSPQYANSPIVMEHSSQCPSITDRLPLLKPYSSSSSSLSVIESNSVNSNLLSASHLTLSSQRVCLTTHIGDALSPLFTVTTLNQLLTLLCRVRFTRTSKMLPDDARAPLVPLAQRPANRTEYPAADEPNAVSRADDCLMQASQQRLSDIVNQRTRCNQPISKRWSSFLQICTKLLFAALAALPVATVDRFGSSASITLAAVFSLVGSFLDWLWQLRAESDREYLAATKKAFEQELKLLVLRNIYMDELDRQRNEELPGGRNTVESAYIYLPHFLYTTLELPLLRPGTAGNRLQQPSPQQEEAFRGVLNRMHPTYQWHESNPLRGKGKGGQVLSIKNVETTRLAMQHSLNGWETPMDTVVAEVSSMLSNSLDSELRSHEQAFRASLGLDD